MTLLASVLVPTRDEERDIEECLACVAAQDVGASALEVVVVDGCSTDRTVELARRAAGQQGFGRFDLIENPQRTTAAGLHMALDRATAPVIVRVDARSRIAPDHVRRVVEVLGERPDVGVVGGAQVPERSDDAGWVTAGIARALSNRFTTGLARYRRLASSGPADTVWMGAFRADDLRRLGGWDPRYGINEDYELNRRFREAGFTVWFDAAIASGYVPRRDLRSLGRQYLAFGRSKGMAWAQGDRPEPRHLLLLAAPLVASAGFVEVARRHGGLVATGASLAGLAAVDAVGTSSPPRSLAERAGAMVATATFASTWWIGAISGWAAATQRGRA